MIWLAGASGMLGSEVAGALTAARLPWIGTGREVDVTDAGAIVKFTAKKNIDWIINCSAYTAVDRAEDEPDACRRLNAAAPGLLARWAAQHGAAMLQVSTDYVFSGLGSRPYLEEDLIGPRSVYGATKAEGEAAVREFCPRHLIVRTAWLYGASGPNFVYTMLRLMRVKDRLGIVHDQKGAPTWTADLARLFPVLIGSAEGRWGTYHASGEGQCTWYEFARAIQEEAIKQSLLARRIELAPLTTAEYPTKAVRPAWSVLSKTKLLEQFGFAFPSWDDSLRSFFRSPLQERFFA